jgi:DNA-binding response OmpR family regulator
MTSVGREMPHAGIPGSLLLGPHVAGHLVQRDEARHAFVIDQQLLLCTPMGYRVLMLLLEQVDRCVPYAQLFARCQDTPSSETVLLRQTRMRMVHLISDLRPKIWVFNWDIVAVMGTGYMLLSSQPEAG